MRLDFDPEVVGECSHDLNREMKDMVCGKASSSIVVGRVATLLAFGSIFVLAPRMGWSQPDEVRVRTLEIDTAAGRVSARDRLESRGIVFRDIEPGVFASWTTQPVGDVNGDGFADLALCWGAMGDVEFEELFLVFGRKDPPQHIDRGSIGAYSSRFIRSRVGLTKSLGVDPRAVPAGDVDADGFDDFFIGIRSFGPPEYSDVKAGADATYRPGTVYLIHGSRNFPRDVDLSDPPESLRVVRFSSRKPNSTVLGWDMTTGGDLNGDGLVDYVFAARFAQAENPPPGISDGPGRVYVLFGRQEGYAGLINLEEAGSTLPGMILEGDTRGQGFGAEVVLAGDVNGDGFGDLLIGVTQSGGSQPVPDHVLLLLGAGNLSPRLTDNGAVAAGRGIRIPRQAASGQERNNIAAPGDLDGDGLADFILGSPGESQHRGATYVVFGQQFTGDSIALTDLVAAGRAARFEGEWGGELGESLDTIDWDGDGHLDLLLGACTTVVRGVKLVGRGYVVKGPLEPESRTLSELWTGELEGGLLTSEVPECLGGAAFHAGDMNGDGAADILLSAPKLPSRFLPNYLEPDLTIDPSVYVIFGTGGKLSPLGLARTLPDVGPLEGGSEVTLVGQGFDARTSVQIGERAAEVVRVETSSRLVVRLPAGTSPGAADVQVERGGQKQIVASAFRYVQPFYPDLDVTGQAAIDGGLVIDAGSGRAAVLDHDGDGFGDVVVDSFDGIAIVYGRRLLSGGEAVNVGLGDDLPPATARLRLSDQDGHEPYAVGDVNGDGKDDLAVASKGLVTMVFGGHRLEGSTEVAELFETGGATLISVGGTRAAGAAGGGDFDGDGIGDLVLYLPGVVSVVRGRATWPPLRGLALEPVFRTSGDSDSYRSAASLVGDIDGDGLAEALIGAPGYHWGDRGKGFLVFGKTDWKAESLEDLAGSGEALQINSVKDRDSLGIRVVQAGDFNGDGTPDIAISAEAGALEFSGESYVVFGVASLRDSPPLELSNLEQKGVRIRGEFGYDEAFDIAPAGDFNGDGRQDLLVSGGNFTTIDNPYPSRSFVVFGGARGMVDLGELGAHGFRITVGERAASIGGTDFNGDGFDDVVIRGGLVLYVIFGSGVEATFIRGDANQNGKVDLSDAISILGHLFLGTLQLHCVDSADTDDNGRVELTDAVYLLGHLFLGSTAPPPPFPAPGSDPTQDSLGCQG